MAKTKTGVNLYINGTKHNSLPIPENGDSYSITDVVNPGDSFTIQESYAYDDLSESGKSILQTLTLDFKTVLTPAQTPIPFIYWPDVYKSSEWPLFTTTKDYFCIYSSDHAQSITAGTYWGEMDTPEFDGFVSRGAIVTGINSPETPWLIKSPSAISGIVDTYFLYYHILTDQIRGAAPVQETKLITTSGGDAPHLCTWADKGFPLGLGAAEQHTGYCRIWGSPERLIANHLTVGGRGVDPLAGSAVSVSTDGGLSFTRLHDVPVNAFERDGYTSDKLQKCVFEYNGLKFAFISMYLPDESKSRIILAEVDDEFLPVNFVKTICNISAYTRTINLYIESGIAYLYHKRGDGIGNAAKEKPYKIYKFKLSELDSYVSIYDLFRTDTIQFMGIGPINNSSDVYFEGTDQENTGADIYNAVNDFMAALDSASLLNKMVAIYPMIGGNDAAHATNLIDSVINTVNWSGTWDHSPTGANPVVTALPFTYGNTGIRPSDTGELTHLSIYSREDITADGMSVQVDAGCYNSQGSAGQLMVSAKRPDGKAYARNSGLDISLTMADAKGFFIVSKQASSLTKFFKNGVFQASATDSGGVSPSSELCIAARGRLPPGFQVITTSCSNRELAFVSFGTALSDTEQLTFYNLIQALQVALKREV